MSTYKTRVEDLVGVLTTTDDAFISDCLVDEAAKLIDLIPEKKVRDYSKNTPVTTVGLSAPGERVLHVFNTAGYEAREVPAHIGKLGADSNSLYQTMERDPMYYLDHTNGKYFIVSDGAKATGNLVSVVYPTIANTDTPGSLASGEKFPKDLERLLVLGTAIRMRLRQISDLRTVAYALVASQLAEAEDLINDQSSLSWIDDDVGDHLNADDVELAQSAIATAAQLLNQASTEIGVYSQSVAPMISGLNSLQQQYNTDLQLMMGREERRDTARADRRN